MAYPVPDTYSVAAGQPINAGRHVLAAPDLVGGTVHALLAGWSGKGFQLLSSAPAVDYNPASAIYTASGHAGAAWDEARGILWMYGCESHGKAQMINTWYRWDAADGLFKRMGAPDPCVGAHHVTADGFLFADAANTRPWGCHTFDTLWFDPATREAGFVYDARDHAYWADYDGWGTVAPAGFDIANRRCPLWYYNTAKGVWRKQDSAAITSFCKGSTGSPVVRDPGNGWWRVDGATVSHLAEDGQTLTSGSIWGVGTYASVQAKLHNFASHLVIVGGFYDTPGTWLGAIHPKAKLAGSTVLKIADFPALAGWDATNTWSAAMPDGRIVFGAQNVSAGATGGVIGAFILDWNKAVPTVTDTGYRLGPSFWAPSQSYELKCVWSTAYNCAILVTNRQGAGTDRVYGLRI